MNIHPSLLPAFAGGMDLNVHEEILKRGCKVSGCSLIFIDEGADTGPIIIQKVCNVENDETADSLKAKVQKLEGEALIEGIELFRDGKLKVEGTIVKVLK
jgi:phosphoribosylglycinamide formyltransferase-1